METRRRGKRGLKEGVYELFWNFEETVIVAPMLESELDNGFWAVCSGNEAELKNILKC